MCGYDPLYWYEKDLDQQYEMDALGIETQEEYFEYLENLKEDTQIQYFECKKGD